MHLREIGNHDDLMDAMCKILDPVSKMSGDPEINKIMTECLAKVSKAETGTERLLCFFPLQKAILNRHRDEAIEIIAATTGRGKKEIEDQSPVQLLADIRDMVMGDFTAFFI